MKNKKEVIESRQIFKSYLAYELKAPDSDLMHPLLIVTADILLAMIKKICTQSENNKHIEWDDAELKIREVLEEYVEFIDENRKDLGVKL